MSTRSVSLLSALALAATLSSSAALAASPDPVAKTLAGLADNTSGVANEDGEQKLLDSFAKTAKEKWGKYWKQIGGPMAKWAAVELPHTAGETIFYPFAGPDLPTAVQLYPNAGHYILVALQTGGRVPNLADFKKPELESYIGIFKRAWIDFARRGFFRTDDLKADTGKGKSLEGITPVLMAFASALGYRVDAVEPIRIKADGSDVEVHPGPKDEVATWDSVRLTLDKNGTKVLVDYLWLDLSDDYLKKHTDAKTWLTKVASNKVFTKAASHLMQKPFFSIMRDTLLKFSPSVVQDETGLDYKDLSKAFDVTLYGRFERAHKLWTEGVQRELATAYKERKDVRKLSFKFGYEKDAGSCVQVAVRKR